MAKYYAKYKVTALDEYPLEEVYTWPSTSISISGVEVKQVFKSTSFEGINRCDLVGLVLASSIPSSELYKGNSWDPVGTEFYGWSKSIEITDENDIPPEYVIAGSPGGESPDPEEPSQVDAPPGFTFSGGVAQTDWNILNGSGRAYAAVDLSKAAEYVTTEAAKAIGLGGLIAPALNALAVHNTLTQFMERALPVLENGIQNFDTLDPNAYDRQVDSLLRDSYGDFTAALEEQLGTGSTASTLIRSINLAVPIVNGDPLVEISAGYEVDLSGGNGILVIGVETNSVTGAELRDFIINLDDGLSASGSPDTVALRGGNDLYIGGDAREAVRGGHGDDELSGAGGVDHLYGDAGVDSIWGGKGADKLWGGTGKDRLKGGDGEDWLAGGDHQDALFGDSGNDKLLGGGSADSLKGGSGSDALEGGGGNDKLEGGDGQDTLKGGSSNDSLRGNDGEDRLYGGSGADRLDGDAGKDWLYAGQDSSRDVFDFNSTKDSRVSARDIIFEFDRGEDKIDLRGIDARAGGDTNNTFAYSGTTAAAYAVWWDERDGDVVVFADVTGDKTADFQLKLENLTRLSSDDFLL